MNHNERTTIKVIRTKTIAAAVLAAALLIPAAAQAHVTVQPNTAPAGGFTRLDVRVPNEQDKAATTKVEVEMPPGFAFASYEPVPGWKTTVKTEKLDQPIQTDDGEIDSQVKTITWTADSTAAGIQPGQFQDFGLSVGLPADGKPGDALTFPAIQTYDNGDVVRWIGDPDSEEPAPQVTLTASADEGHMASATEEEASSSDDGGDSEGAPTWLAILGVALGAAGLLTGGLALGRRRS
jgi:uncharacterized protein YcnI